MTFLKNVWYVAANADELDNGLLARTICNEPLVMYRTSTGDVAALEDRCPHRFVPMSMGKRIGDTLQCGYHGLRFDHTGACVEKPNDADNHNLNPCLKSYPTVERYNVIWVWLGRKDLADPAKIPEFNFITDKEHFGSGQSYLHFKASYEVIVDNLLDLSHVHYLHPEAHGGSEFSNFKNEVKLDGETIWSILWRPDYYMDEAKRKMWGFKSEHVNGQGHSRWNAPSVIHIYTAYWEKGQSIDDGIQMPSAHLMTPETEFTTHYFLAAGHSFDIHNPEASARMIGGATNVVQTQDGPMFEAQQNAMGDTTDFLDQHPMILKADAAGVMARRYMKRKIREEQEAVSAVAAE